MKIIVDGFGGDNAPGEALLGCAQAVREYGVEIIVTGPAAELEKTAKEKQIDLRNITFHDAGGGFPMTSEPTEILKSQKNSSMAVGFELLASGEGEAFVTAGSTGAAVVGATFLVKRIRGVRRAAIGMVVPSSTGCYMLLDSGANHDCRPEMLRQFGVMGSVYMEKILGVEKPRVGVVNIGAEPNKGTDLQIEANRLLADAGVNFIGNVEARDLPLGGCDVAVCDGFTGNVILKLMEGFAKMFMGKLKEAFYRTPFTKLAALVLKPGLMKIRRDFDYTEYGGAMLLGVRKPVIKAHGSSNAKAFCNAVRQAMDCARSDVIGRIEGSLALAEPDPEEK